ncbi:lateral signaling target protein 2 [Plasmopara halstedii]|uniref:Lateral signaling target protein 2 n=1 Tax=Plasmopara halstedii TaxID=4781 RepID=A0A0P1AQ56_PLAHL|nr:lateral signaling target protein 2 [Plasmopara halstedii]CEG43506.1 lateral signaling target protein 2 [Plasmopara halstedii]|eukprot:XP_024579875.1 lateral signaling target protein 2 [Plasmopara halstedii]
MGVSVNSCDSPLALPSARSLPTTKENNHPPRWRPDTASDACLCCGNNFSIWTRRRHHCRACGELVCGECSPFHVQLPELGYKGRVRVCTHCNALAESSLNSSASTDSLTGLESAAASSESSDNEQLGDVEEELIVAAVDLLALTSRNKCSKVQYQYFVQSEAVSWLMDAGIMSSRTGCAALFLRLVDYGYVTLKPWNGSGRSAFYILAEELTLENRMSRYDTAIHSETSKCNNCAQSFQKAFTPADGFCSIDCKTNALISQSDSARIRSFCN